MHNNYFFLRRLIPQLAEKIIGLTLTDNFIVHNEEIVFEFSNSTEKYYFKTIADGQIGLNILKSDYSKPKKNFRTWNKNIVGLKVIAVRVYDNERAFLIDVGSHKIIFKMFGTRSNVILFEQNNLIQVLHRKLKSDYDIENDHIDRKLDTSFGYFKQINGDISTFLPTIGKHLPE